MYILVLTGGLGAGKSTAARFFRERGAVVIDLDDVSRHALVPGSPVMAQLVEEFGPNVVRSDGALDRGNLADHAFGSAASVARLNAIVHPAIAREVGPALDELRLMPHQPSMVVLEVPLLAEAPVYAELGDEVLAIAAPLDVRVSRAVAKGIAEDDARRRIVLQASDAERAALADVVIVNDRDRESYTAALVEFWDSRFARDGGVSESA